MNARQDIRKFFETTSIRGIPRALKSENKVLVVVWWVAVFSCTTLLISQLTLLLITYFKYGYTTSYSEGITEPVSDI